MMRKIFGLILLATLIVSCGSRKGTGKIATSNPEATGIIEKHYANAADFKTLAGRLRTSYQTEDKSQSVNLSFRMKKDEAIWLSATVMGFPVARAYITPRRVSYYEKVGKTYFDGDFSLLSNLVGTPLDFEKLQNLLMGQAIYDLRAEEFDFLETARGYQFIPVENKGFKKMFLLDPKNLKAEAQQLAQENENRSVTVTYSGYQEISGRFFPEEIKIIANEGSGSTKIDLSYRSIEVNPEVNFPFEIPSGYEEIDL